ncbi:MAG: type VI secretion system-associated protein TagO, partial [Halomonas sp.]|uniref:type VI secretion system-associated protein TagO n=1 Tax=Halomonas sp. TaxID=1486246 RepID=UPI003F8ED8FE
MKMTLLTRQWSCRTLLMIGACSSAGLYADEHQAGLESVLDNAQACAEEPSRLDRLSCYDNVFKPTLTATNDSKLSDLWYAIERQESERDTQALGLMVEQAGDDVLMSVPALGTTPPRP